jgi:hypothetical protein
MIARNVKAFLEELGPGILLVAAAKGRSVTEIQEAVAAGLTAVGENYVQEAQK